MRALHQLAGRPAPRRRPRAGPGALGLAVGARGDVRAQSTLPLVAGTRGGVRLHGCGELREANLARAVAVDNLHDLHRGGGFSSARRRKEKVGVCVCV